MHPSIPPDTVPAGDCDRIAISIPVSISARVLVCLPACPPACWRARWQPQRPRPWLGATEGGMPVSQPVALHRSISAPQSACILHPASCIRVCIALSAQERARRTNRNAPALRVALCTRLRVRAFARLRTLHRSTHCTLPCTSLV